MKGGGEMAKNKLGSMMKDKRRFFFLRGNQRELRQQALRNTRITGIWVGVQQVFNNKKKKIDTFESLADRGRGPRPKIGRQTWV